MEKYTFIILPYLTIEKEFTFGDSRFVPFNIKKIRAANEVKKLSKLIAKQYHTVSNRSLDEVTFVFIQNKQFGEFMSDDEKTRIGDSLKLLFLIAFRRNQQVEVRTADNFEPFIYDVQSGSERISTKSGGVHDLTVGGYHLKKMNFTKPTFVHTTIKNFYPLNEYVAPLEEVLFDNNLSNFMRAADFFFQSYMNDERIPQVNRVTNLYLAFLALMRVLPTDHERDLWHNNMANISEPSLVGYRYPIVNTQSGISRPSLRPLNIAQIWGDEFYKLRCKILHGDPLTSQDYLFQDISGNNLVTETIPHFYLGANIFFALFFHLLGLSVSNTPDFKISDTDILSINPTGLGFGNRRFKLPLFVNDLSLIRKLSTLTRP